MQEADFDAKSTSKSNSPIMLGSYQFAPPCIERRSFMSGLFGTLNTARSGLDANQIALQTSSHNIANTNTDGYSRQRVDLSTKIPFSKAGVGLIGSGVQAAGISRIVDDFIRSQVRDSNSDYNFNVQKSDILGLLENALHEPSDDGLIAQLNNFADSLQKLADNPELDTAKTNSVQMGVALASYIKQTAREVAQISSDTRSSLAKNALDFNEKAEQLANLNQQLYDSHSNDEQPNDLLDQRDSLLKEMSSESDLSVSFDQYGRASVSIGKQVVVDNKEGVQIKLDVVVSGSDGQTQILPNGDETQSKQTIAGEFSVGDIIFAAADGSGNYTKLAVSSGSIGGLQESLVEVEDHRRELNDFAKGIVEIENIVYTDGQTPDSGFFEITDPNDPALSIKVNDDLVTEPGKMRVGSGEEPAAGDNARALAMVRAMKSKFNYPINTAALLASYDKDDMIFNDPSEGLTIPGAYNSIVTKNGISKQKADNMQAAQLAALNQLEYKDQAVSGVNLNEEMSDVIRFQQGFQANAKILTVVSEMLDTLINRTEV